MTEAIIKHGSKEWRNLMNIVYGDQMIQSNDILGTEFLNLSGKSGLDFFADKLDLNQECHILDLGCGYGGPARYLAKQYGCKVTGVDISEKNIAEGIKRTKAMKLEHLVDYILGNVLEVKLPEEYYTHVIGYEAWLYFPDKVQLYKTAYRSLKPNAIITFIEPASDIPRENNWGKYSGKFYNNISKQANLEEIIGKIYVESIADYTAMLKEAGFHSIHHFNITDNACKEITHTMFSIIRNRDEFIRVFGAKDLYYINMEYYVECLSYLAEGVVTENCFIAQK